MAQFRQKPPVIEAIQWTGINDIEVAEFLGDTHWKENILLKANEGDWVIKGGRGQFYAYSPDIFERNYEPMTASKAK